MMVNDPNNKALAAGETDSYKFAKPFVRASLENADLDNLRSEAKSLAQDLAAQDANAQPIIAAYRQQAKQAGAQGQAIPPLPTEIYQLQATRTAIITNHMMTLQSKLGKEKTALLENYFKREVTPRVSLTPLAHPPVDPKSIASPSGSVASQP